jgi:hypothetical protein
MSEVPSREEIARVVDASRALRLRSEEGVRADERKALDREAPTLAALYGHADLQRDQARELVSLEALPPWPDSDEGPCRLPVKRLSAGHGWGTRLDRMLGGGVCPGYMLGIGAASAKAGKTLIAMQIADGLALRSASLLREARPGPLTPVMVLSEMSPQALSWRSLARWTGHDSTIFRAGRSARTLRDPELVDAAWRSAERALDPDSLFGHARSLMRALWPPLGGGPELLHRVAERLKRWVGDLQEDYSREVWPVVVIDPIQRWQARGAGEVEALNELVEVLGEVAYAGRWVVIVTSDTNKASASGGSDPKKVRTPQEEGAAAFRGSYKLQHLLDAGLYLRRPEDAPDSLDGIVEVESVVVFNRWGAATQPFPRFTVDLKRARFVAHDVDDERRAIAREAPPAQAGNNRHSHKQGNGRPNLSPTTAREPLNGRDGSTP